MQKRLLLAVIISVMILIFFQKIENRNQESVKTESEKITIHSSKVHDDNVATIPSRKIKDKMESSQPLSDDYVETVQELNSENIDLKIGLAKGGITSLRIKDKNGKMVELVRSGRKKPLEIEKSRNWQIIDKDSSHIDLSSRSRSIAWKRSILLETDNRITIVTVIKNISGNNLDIEFEQGWHNGLGTTEELENENYGDNRPFGKIADEIKSDLDKDTYEGSIGWTGVVNRYFLVVFTDIDPIFNRLQVTRGEKKGRGCIPGRTSGKDGEFPSVILSGIIKLEPGQSREVVYELYSGLKEYTKLKSIKEGMEKILSFGVFGFLSRIFLNVLVWFKAVTGNYGLSIILLTLFLQVFMFPLTAKSYKSMQKMKDLQPKINKVRKKFKDDPQRMNQEMMQMYKRYKINPMSGCFPLLLQMPIFISLFTMLRNAAELRFAGFLWITDLSKADVLFSAIPHVNKIPVIGGAGPLPFLMGGAMFLQQKMTGSSEGPQKSLMYMMPIVFTFLFIKFPAGLVLYWLCNSLLTFVIQLFVSKKQS